MKNHYTRLVETINAAGWEPEKWGDVVSECSSVFGDALTQFHISEPHTSNKPFIISRNVDEQAMKTFENHFSRLNPYPAMVLNQKFIGQAEAATRFIPADVGKRMEFYNDWMKPNGWSLNHFGVALFNTETRIAILCMSPQTDCPLDKIGENIQNLQTLVAPMQRALQLNRITARANTSDGTLQFAIEQMDAAVFILDNRNRVQLRNRRSKAVTDLDQVLGIDQLGKLYCPNAASHTRLQNILAAIEAPGGKAGGSSGWVNLTPHAQNEHYIVRVARYADYNAVQPSSSSPLLQALYPNRLKMLVVKKLTRAIEVSPASLQEVLGLTPAEAKLAATLAAGKSQREYAEKAGITMGTTRDHAKSIYSKLGVSGHPQLLLYISNLRDMGLIG